MSSLYRSDFLEVAGELVDSVKLSQVQALTYPETWIREKVALYKSHNIMVYSGGLLVEIAWLQDKVRRVAEAVKSLGIDGMEVSENFITLAGSQRRKLIGEIRALGLEVVYEFGRKYPTCPLDLDEATKTLLGGVEAGARYVVLERGEVGLLSDSHADILCKLVDQVGRDKLFFEAISEEFPRSHVWLIKTLGPDVNLGNVFPM